MVAHLIASPGHELILGGHSLGGAICQSDSWLDESVRNAIPLPNAALTPLN